MQPPATNYVERNGVSIAYQVVGEGPIDLLLAPGFISHLDLQWTEPHFSRFLTRLTEFARVILYDKPGTGLSDPIPHVPTLEERTADIEAVLDALGDEQPKAAETRPLDGPAAHMRRSDRVAVSLARRAPRMMRFGARMANRGA